MEHDYSCLYCLRQMTTTVTSAEAHRTLADGTKLYCQRHQCRLRYEQMPDQLGGPFAINLIASRR